MAGEPGRLPAGPITRGIRTGFLAGMAIAFAGTEAPGYRFYDYNGEGAISSSSAAVFWSESVWAPGETLTWVVADDPGWTASWTDSSGAGRPPPLGSPEEVVPVIRTALEAWSEIPSADIRWEVSGVDPTLDTAEWGDGRPTIFVDPDAERGSYAGIWFDRSAGGEWELVDCEVPLAPFAAAAVNDDPWWTYVLIHEFGHCLGLDHAGAYPRINEGRELDLRGVFGKDPLMSYGDFYGDIVRLAPDDRTGASLLRPAPDWRAATGGLAGVVMAGDGPAPFVQVFATRVSGGAAAGSVGGFTNEEGEFVIEGLDPGRYLLWAGPLNVLLAHGELLARGALLDAREHALLLPATVVRGAVTDGIEVRLQGGTRDGATAQLE